MSGGYVGWAPPAGAGTPVPPGVISVREGTDLQPIVDAAANGTEIWLGTGAFYGLVSSPSTPITVPLTKSITFRGVSRDSTIVKSPFLFQSGHNRLFNLWVRPSGTAYGVKIYNGGTPFIARCSMNDVFIGASFAGAGDGPVVGLWLDGAGVLTVENSIISFNTGDGLFIDSTGAEPNTTCKFSQVSFVQNGGWGIHVEGSGNVFTFEGGSCQDNATGEALIQGVTNVVLDAFYFERSIACTNVLQMQVSCGRVENCIFALTGAPDVPRAIALFTSSGVKIAGNRFSGFTNRTAVGGNGAITAIDENSTDCRIDDDNLLLDAGTYLHSFSRRTQYAGNPMRPGSPHQPGLQSFSGMLWLPSAVGDGAGGLGPLWNPGTGAVTRPTPGTTTPTQLLRAQFANSAANQELGPRFAGASECAFWKGNAADLGGFYFASTFVIEAWANDSARLFVGLASNAAGSVCLNDVAGIPASDLVGLYHDTADGANVLQLVTAAGGAAAKGALNFPFAGTLAAGNAFKFEMWCHPNSLRVYGLMTDYVLGTKLAMFQTDGGPRTNILMGPQCQMGNAANAGAGLFALSPANVLAVQR